MSTYAGLRIWAEMFDDAQKARIAASNRSARGEVDPGFYDDHIEQLTKVEEECSIELRRCFRTTVPAGVVAWQKETPGIGEHLLARLLGHTGDPFHATPKYWVGNGKGVRELAEGEPFDRSVAQLWSYCGLGDSTRKRKSGMSADDAMALGKPLPKALLFLMAEGCKKLMGTGNKPVSPYRLVYDQRREETAGRTHETPCVRCGPSGKPAQPGSDWSDGHKQADALRIVSKEILRDIWLVSQGRPAMYGNLGGEVETIPIANSNAHPSSPPVKPSRRKTTVNAQSIIPASSVDFSDPAFDADADDAWVREQFEGLEFKAA